MARFQIKGKLLCVIPQLSGMSAHDIGIGPQRMEVKENKINLNSKLL